jgi:hypothetical protein
MDKRRKELLFLTAGLAVLMIALYLTFRPGTPPAQAKTEVSASVSAVAPAPPAPAAQVQIVTPLPMSEGGTTAGRNPFTPVVAMVRAATPTGSPPPLRTAMALPPLPPIRPMSLELFGNEPGSGNVTAGIITPGEPGRAVEPTLQLTGIIYGDPSVAILRKGEKRYFLRPGDPVGSRYVVQSISHRRVVLADVGTPHGTPLQLDLTGRL